MIIYIAEIVGTFIYVYMTLAIIANATVFGGNKNNILLITSLGTGIAYIIPCIVFGDVSGAHFNPAITIATAIFDIFEIKFMWGYIISEIIGALFASIIYVAINIEKFNNLNIQSADYAKLYGVVPTGKSFLTNVAKEIFASFIMMFGMIGVTYMIKAVETESIYILYFIIIVGIGLTFDYTEVAVNPMRDIFIRIIYIFAPCRRKEKVNLFYGIVTVVAPIIGALLAVAFYKYIPWNL